jgi:hypothetical protein
MGKCKYCGAPAGLFRKAHPDCIKNTKKRYKNPIRFQAILFLKAKDLAQCLYGSIQFPYINPSDAPISV